MYHPINKKLNKQYKQTDFCKPFPHYAKLEIHFYLTISNLFMGAFIAYNRF